MSNNQFLKDTGEQMSDLDQYLAKLVKESEAKEKEEDQQRTKTTEVIPVELIDNREENDYSISDIDELAKSIKEHGLQQNIVVKKVGDRYSLIAGERRLTAFKKLKEETGNNLYDTITAEVYTQITDRVEDAIYKETNDTQRNSSLFERIYRTKPRNRFFCKPNEDVKNQDMMAEYIRMKVENGTEGWDFKNTPEEIAAGQCADMNYVVAKDQEFVSRIPNKEGKTIVIKWDDNKTMNDYILLKLKQRYKDINISSDAIKKYTSSIMNTKHIPIITDLILSRGVLSPKDLRSIASKDENTQKNIYSLIDTGKLDARQLRVIFELSDELQNLVMTIILVGLRSIEDLEVYFTEDEDFQRNLYKGILNGQEVDEYVASYMESKNNRGDDDSKDNELELKELSQKVSSMVETLKLVKRKFREANIDINDLETADRKKFRKIQNIVKIIQEIDEIPEPKKK